jgi:hypothetical protein
MTDSARVTSIEALEDFKATLLAFCEEVKEAFCSVQREGDRTMSWLLREQVGRWERAVRDRQEEVMEAKNELFRKQLFHPAQERPDCIRERKAVRRAEERVREAQQKVENCKRWAHQQLPRVLGEFAGPARQLMEFVEGEPPPMVVVLERVLTNLEAYLQEAPPPAPERTGPAGSMSRPPEESLASPSPAPESAPPQVPPS